MNLKSISNRDLCDEVQRRTSNGSNLLSRYWILPKEVNVMNDANNNAVDAKPGSRKKLFLTNLLSDQALMEEVQGRIMNGDKDAVIKFKLMLKNVRYTETIKGM